MSNNDVSFLSYVKEPTEEDFGQIMVYLSLLRDRYKDTISTLPKEKGWISENLYQYKGFWYSLNDPISIETLLALQDKFRAHPADIYVVTLPKSGTTWMKALVFAIVNRERYKNNPLASHPLLIHNPHNCVPYIEEEILKKTSMYADGCNPRLFGSHAPYSLLPRSILDSGCRIVYICRNPKDVFVSSFQFLMKFKGRSCEMSFDEAFEMFRNGASPCGPYWEHVKGYYDASLEHQSKILFLTYEDMHEDTVNHIKLLARFLGYPFSEDEEAQGVVDEIVRLCSFENLREVNKHGEYIKGLPNDSFFREGKVGDWKNHLTDEMSRILDGITKEKFQGLNISFEADAQQITN